MKSGSSGDGADFLGLQSADKGPQSSATGWFISQAMGAVTDDFNPVYNTTELFRLHALSSNGEQTQREIKISIQDIRVPTAQEKVVNPYPSFSVVVRKLRDTDLRPSVLETFSNCNLNPNSSNYVAKVIGDVYYEWDNTKMRLKEYGTYPNNSKIVRIEMASEVDLGQADPELLPFGVQGPVKREGFKIGFTTGGVNRDTEDYFRFEVKKFLLLRGKT